MELSTFQILLTKLCTVTDPSAVSEPVTDISKKYCFTDGVWSSQKSLIYIVRESHEVVAQGTKEPDNVIVVIDPDTKLQSVLQHGYRNAETIQTSLDEAFYFVGKVLGFEPAEKDRKGRTHICKIHARSMSVEKDNCYELLARLCPNSTGAEIRSVCTEAGMFAIRAPRKVAKEKDFLKAVNKVIKAYAKSIATPCYMT